MNPEFTINRIRTQQPMPDVAMAQLTKSENLRMIGLGSSVTELGSCRAEQQLPSPLRNALPDAFYWSTQMSAVALQRDRVSFMRIYDYFAPRLQRYLFSLGVPIPLADELVQETLLTLWRKAHLFDPGRATLSTWLFRVARNLYIDHVRREPHWLPIQEGLDQLDRVECYRRDSQPESYLDEDILKRAIDRLPTKQAKLVRMCYLESKSHREISRELEMPLGSVKSSLRRAFAKLQGSMGSPR